MAPKPIILDFGYTKVFQKIQEEPQIIFWKILVREISTSQRPKIVEKTRPNMLSVFSNLNLWKFESVVLKKMKWKFCKFENLKSGN